MAGKKKIEDLKAWLDQEEARLRQEMENHRPGSKKRRKLKSRIESLKHVRSTAEKVGT